MANARRFTFKVLEQTNPNTPDKIDYKEMLKAQLRQGGTQGLTVGEMADRIEVLELLTDDATEVVIKAGTHASLVKALESERFTIASSNLIQFVTDFKNAPEVEAKLQAVE